MLKQRHATLAFSVALLGWVLFLRWPSLGVTLWNVDESIHAAVARTLLDGGTLYHDAIDQRTPLTYWLVTAVFSVCGANNLFALRLAFAALLAATASGLFLLGRRTWDTATGLLAAVIFVALSANLLPASDAFATHTEWVVIAFTTAGAWWFWHRRESPGFATGLTGGALSALAFLSKQPALLDLAAPLAAAVWFGASGLWGRGATLRTLAGLIGGFVGLVALVAAYFLHAGALDDAIFYTWTYNLHYYGPEISTVDRVASGLQPFALLAHRFPLVLLAVLGGTGALLVRIVQLQPSPQARSANPWNCYLLVWVAASLAGAASGGRGFEHYTIQCLPAFALLAAHAFAALGNWVEQVLPARRLGLVLLCSLVGIIGAKSLIQTRATYRSSQPPVDPATRAAAFIRERTTDTDSLFVWGYNPDIYLYSGRKPASRFVYCSFLTGLIPWTNLDPHRDTAYAVVPGSMETLLGELERHRPAFVVDCSPGPHRHFQKYPIAHFPRLQALLDRDYTDVSPDTFVPQGFRLHLLRDHARRTPLPLAGGPAIAAPSAPQLFGRTAVEAQVTTYTIACAAPDGRLQRLELLADGAVVDGVSVAPCHELTVVLRAPFDRLGSGSHRLAARATRADGSVTLSPETTVTCSTEALPLEKLASFRVPTATRLLTPAHVRAPFGPSAQREGETVVFAVHAPSSLLFDLAPDIRHVRGGFGIRPGAYTPDNPAPTDGARFRIILLTPDGTRSVLMERLLRPRETEADRPVQRFELTLPAHAAGTQLEFTTDPGPADNAACDWTFWSDLAIDNLD